MIDPVEPTLVEKVVIQRKDAFDKLPERDVEAGARRVLSQLGDDQRPRG